MIADFSRAISVSVGPSSATWSIATGVTIATSLAIRFVASQEPPMPTSNTPSATGLSANHRNASAVTASKYVTSPIPWPSIRSR